jgi:O-antigen/teichoic acid export membrane protein
VTINSEATHRQPSIRIRRIAIHTTVAMIARIGGILAQVLTLAFITRGLPIAEVGVFASITGASVLARSLGPLGFDQIILRSVPALININGEPSAHVFVRSCAKRVLIPHLAILTIGLVASGVLAGEGNQWATAIAAMFAVIACNSATGFVASTLRSFDRIVPSFLPDAFFGPVIALILTASLWFIQGLTLNAALWSFVASCAVVVALNLYNARNILLRVRMAIHEPPPSFHPSYIKSMMLLAPLAVTQLQFKSPLYIAIFILGPSAGAVVEIASKFGLLPTLVTWSATLSFGNQIPRAVAQNDLKLAQKLVIYSTWMSFLPSVLFLVFFAAAGPFVLPILFGEPYMQAFWQSRLFITARAINASGSMASTTMLMLNKEGYVTRYTIASLVIIILGGWLGAMLVGTQGVIAGMILAAITRDVGLSIRLHRHTGLYSPIYSVEGLRHSAAIAAQSFRRINFRRSVGDE